MPELNAQQFGQPELPGMPPSRALPVVQPHGKTAAEKRQDSISDYGGASGAHSMRGGLHGESSVTNPLHVDTSAQAMDVAYDYGRNAESLMRSGGGKGDFRTKREWVPTDRIWSQQAVINQSAVDHQVENADPMRLRYEPKMKAYGDAFLVRDGNHRVNAAKSRGQLFMSANVQRESGDPTHLGRA